MKFRKITAFFCTVLLAVKVWGIAPDVLYFSADFDGIAPAGGSLSLPREAVVSNLVAEADQKWYKRGAEGAVVASVSCEEINKTPPPGITGGAALRVGDTTNSLLSAYVALTNEVWDTNYDYTLSVVHRLAHRDGSVTNIAATGSLCSRLAYVQDGGSLVYVGEINNVRMNPSNWSTTVVHVAGADLAEAAGKPLIIELVHQLPDNTADHFTWVDSVMLLRQSQKKQLAEGRGIWCWNSPDETWGFANIVTDPVKEDGAIREFLRWGIKRVYGGYGGSNLMLDDPEGMAKWNKKLAEAGVESALLLGEPTWIFPDKRLGLLDIIQQRLIDYNNSRSLSSERFKALHLDIEPHTIEPRWPNIDDEEKQERLWLLLDTFRDTRAYLDANGASDIPIFADLPVWYEKDSCGWASSAESLQWFQTAAAYLEGISLMAYIGNTFDRISETVQWEVENFPGEVRIGLEAKIGPEENWESMDAFMSMAEQIEAAYGSAAGIDIHSLVRFGPHVPRTPAVLGTPNIRDGKLILPVSGYTPSATNRIERCENLLSNDWVLVEEFVSWAESTNWTGVADATQAYYRVVNPQ